jgi:coenzyme Q-binding protein COQ10
MPTHAEQRVLPYSPKELYDLVADIERYPEFLPWCIAARVRRQEDNVIHADIVIGYKVLREKFTSRDTLTPPGVDESGRETAGRIDVAYLEGPFRYLNNHWIFEPTPDGGCRIDFYIDFEFHTRIFQKLMAALFNEAVRLMVSSFANRARDLYGPREGGATGRPEGAPTSSPGEGRAEGYPHKRA